MKYAILSVLALTACFVPAWLLAGIIARRRGYKTGKRILLTAVAGLLLFSAAALGYLEFYYHGDQTAHTALNSDDTVQVEKIKNGYLFDGPGKGKAVIFYPGGKVEGIAYAPLLRKLAAAGTDCFLAEMPFRMAIFGSGRAEAIIRDYDYEHWYLAGHSLGGTAAALYASSHESELDGIILLASYSTKKLNGIALLSVYGTLDGCLEMEQYAANKNNWPADHEESLISGGNHCQFGNYGHQKGDGQAEIDADRQQDETVKIITKWLANH